VTSLPSNWKRAPHDAPAGAGDDEPDEGDGMNELLCGCRRGAFLCPEAEILWARVNASYQQACRATTSGTHWEVYEAAREEYRKHVTGQWRGRHDSSRPDPGRGGVG
jgi:hypothetical protein